MSQTIRKTTRRFVIAAAAAACLALPSAAQAHMHTHSLHVHRAKAVLVPAHLRPGYPEAARAALLFPIDLGMGPVFPFSGIPLK